MTGTALEAAVVAVCAAAAVVAGVRWLRVAQREHYLPGSVSRFARRWWLMGANRWLAVVAVAGVAATAAGVVPAAFATAVCVALGPIGLGLRGRSSPLAWTRRLRLLAVLSALVAAAAIAVASVGGWRAASAVAAAVALVAPVLVDAALGIALPLENRMGARFVQRAKDRLASVRPTVVAITGSYGKTGTKGYVAQLVAGTRSVVATPASFNNKMGLSRAINEGLGPGTEVFVAEMGTYGPGEIAGLCSWIVPSIAVITAIGPVHLERMGSEERIARAKAEILERAPVVVLNVDSPWLAPLAEQAAAAGKKVWRCSATDPGADVQVVAAVGGLQVWASPRGTRIMLAEVAGLEAPPTNVACAVAVALEVGVPPAAIGERVASLPTPAHRRTVGQGSSGATVIDDTYNSNPAGAGAALDLAGRSRRPGGKLVVVTPGMVELGSRQASENELFAKAVGGVASHLLIVGRTNLAALRAGAEGGGAEVIPVRTRQEAVEWVTAHLGVGDVVLYENDLPDHFP